MTLLEVLGYFGGLLVFSTFYLKTMIRMRLVAVASNVMFVAYGWMGNLVPILALHLLLLPLNVWRFAEIKQLIRKVRASEQTGVAAPDLILPYMQQVQRNKGEQLFAKGDRADCVYYLVKGSARLLEKNIAVPQGQMIGIIGIFSSGHRRTDTAVCLSDAELGMISKDKILELFHQSPDFGAFLIRLVARRAALDNTQHTVVDELVAGVPKYASGLQ